jgi:hypothetical protein
MDLEMNEERGEEIEKEAENRSVDENSLPFKAFDVLEARYRQVGQELPWKKKEDIKNQLKRRCKPAKSPAAMSKEDIILQ